MKIILSIILMVSFLLNTAGLSLVYYIMHYENHERVLQLIHKGIADEYLTILKIPKASINQNNPSFHRIDDNEIKYMGHMYDVLKEETHNDIVYFYCMNDENEDLIIAHFENYLNPDGEGNQIKNKQENNLLKYQLKNLAKDYIAFQKQNFSFISILNHSLKTYQVKSCPGFPFTLSTPPWLI